jgi:hypothetical protein
MKLILIAGHAYAGKDTVAKFMKEELESNGKKVLIVHFADFLKHICKAYFGWSGLKDNEGRTLLQYVGTDLIRSKNENFWVNVVCELAKVLQDQFDYILVPDTRFPGEISTPREIYYFDVTSIQVIRYDEHGNLFDNGLTEQQKNHSSETSLNTFKFDIYIHNDGNLEELKEKSRKIANKI